jgi:hypothetical protein
LVISLRRPPQLGLAVDVEVEFYPSGRRVRVSRVQANTTVQVCEEQPGSVPEARLLPATAVEVGRKDGAS